MKNVIKSLTVSILISIGIFTVNAQEQSIVSVNETSTTTEKVEKKAATKKRQSSSDNSWTGFYIGGFGGYTNGKATANTSTIVANVEGGYYGLPINVNAINSGAVQKLKSTGFSGGGLFGYNYQKSKFLIGAEIDFSSNRINKSETKTALLNPSRDDLFFTISQSVKSDWLLTARPRLGVTVKKILLYATGGFAVTNVKYAANFTDNLGRAANESGNFSKTKTGWTAGGGIEIKIAKKWSVKSEYLFSQFGRLSITSNNFIANGLGANPVPVPRPLQTFTHSTDLKSHNIRFGINYRF